MEGTFFEGGGHLYFIGFPEHSPIVIYLLPPGCIYSFYFRCFGGQVGSHPNSICHKPSDS